MDIYMTEFRVSMARADRIDILQYQEILDLQEDIAKTPVKINKDSFDEFFRLVGEKGCVLCPATFKNKPYSEENFEQAQLFVLYFDSKTNKGKKRVSHYDVFERAKRFEIPPLFAYDVFSNRLFDEKDKRFCVGFLLSTPIYDLKEAKAVQKALMQIFPEADPSCSVLKTYNCGNRRLAITKNMPEIDVEWLFMKMCLHLKEKYGSTNYKRKIIEFSEDTEILLNDKNFPFLTITEDIDFTISIENNKKLPKPIIYNIGFGKNLLKLKYQVHFNNEIGFSYLDKDTISRTTYRSDDLKLLNTTCQLYQEFTSGNRVLNRKELFGLASNISQIEAGKKKFLSTFRLNSYPKKKYDDWSFQLGYLKHRDVLPCNTFCPYHSTCPHGRTILSTLKPKYHQMERIESYDEQLVSLEEAYSDFVQKFFEAVHSDKKGWHILQAQTAIGKTSVILSLLLEFTLKILLAVPSNKLKRETCDRAKETGVDLLASPSLHELKEFLPDEIWEEIEALYAAGKSPTAYIDKLIRHSDKAYVELFTQYKKDMLSFHAHDRAITTHRRLTNLDLSKYDLIIVDEDIIYSTIIPNRENISIADLKRLKKKLDEKDPLKAKVKKILKKSKEEEFFTVEEIEYRDIYDDLEMEANIAALCSAKHFCYRENSDSEPGEQDECVTFVIPIEFPEDKKYIMLSATADKEICEYYFGKDNVTFYDCKKAPILGTLYQYGDRNMSRSAMRQDKKRLEKIKKWTGIEHTISFKEFESDYDIDLHFGNCSGFDLFKGKNIDVIGTPHQPEWVYKLFAYSLGFDVDEKLKPQTIVIHNGFRFRFTTYEDKILRNIQFYMIESELEQAVGRARLLRCDCTVNLFSDFPLKQAVLGVSEYDN